MLDKLRAHYKDDMIVNGHTDKLDEYEWFSTDNYDVIGIRKHMLTSKERALLSIFLTPLSYVPPAMNEQQRAWHRFLLHKDDTVFHTLSSSTYTRFIQFHIQKGTVEARDFIEAVRAFFHDHVVIVWEDDAHFTVVEQWDNEMTTLAVDEWIDTLSSDFYIQLRAYVGQKCAHSPQLIHLYATEKQCFTLAMKHKPEQRVYCIEDTFPLLLIHREEMTYAATFLEAIKDDDDMLKTVKMFFECNLNVSLAAKKLYMHRNSLQYRIDKFIEKTGIDIKQLKGALTVYLAILLRERTR